MPDALDIQDVSKRFGARWALARLSFKLPEGRSLLLTGHNGSGKTTLLRLIAGAASPTAGTIRVLGHDATRDRLLVRHSVGLLSHASFLYEDLTARQNLLFLGRLVGISGAKEKVDVLLGRVGLAERAHHSVRQFSAGMRKRLAIARLLLKQPKLALLDEPFGELDPAGMTLMEKLIGELRASGSTVVLATHLVEQGRALCDERLHLAQGRRGEA